MSPAETIKRAAWVTSAPRRAAAASRSTGLGHASQARRDNPRRPSRRPRERWPIGCAHRSPRRTSCPAGGEGDESHRSVVTAEPPPCPTAPKIGPASALAAQNRQPGDPSTPVRRPSSWERPLPKAAPTTAHRSGQGSAPPRDRAGASQTRIGVTGMTAPTRTKPSHSRPAGVFGRTPGRFHWYSCSSC